MPQPSLVLFLGAGFSRGLWKDIPLTDGLTKAVLERLGEHRERVRRAILRLFPHLPDAADADFETFLGVIDGLRKLPPERRLFLEDDPQELWTALIPALGRAVHRGVRYDQFEKHPGLIAFIRMLTEAQARFASVSVVTTNYDVVADSAVFRIHDDLLGHPAGEPSVDTRLDLRRYTYGFRIRGLWDRAEGGKTELVPLTHPFTPVHRAILVCKLHGSVNWAYCEECRSLDISYDREALKSVFGREPPRCARKGCRGTYTWLILPPTHTKLYDHRVLAAVWRRAETALADAGEVLFIGYALPPADPLVAHLILRAHAASRHKRGRAWNYSVINPDRDAHDRLRRLLGPARRNLREDFTPQRFVEDWMDLLGGA